MRIPFAKLMEMVADRLVTDADATLGQLAQEWGEDSSRIMDAIDANKVVNGQRGYI